MSGSDRSPDDLRAEVQLLRASERKYRTLVESMEDLVFTLDREGRHTEVLGGWLARFGQSAERFLGKTAREIFGPGAAPAHEEATCQALAGEYVVYEWSQSTPGGPRYYQTSLAPLRDESRQVTGVLGIGRDITPLRAGEKRFRTILERNPSGIVLVAPDGTIRYDVTSTGRLLGYAEDLTGRSILDLVHPDDREAARQHLERLAADPSADFTLEVRARHRDGSWRWVEATGTNLLAEPAVGAILINYREVSERRTAAEALARRENLYRRAIEAAGAVPYARDYRSGRFDYVGPGIEALLGIPAGQFTVEAWNACVVEVRPQGSDQLLSAAEATERLRREDQPGWWAEVRVRTAQGAEKWLFNAAVKVRDDAGELVGSLGLLQDITARKQTEERLRQREMQLAEAQRIAHIGSWEWHIPSNTVTWTDEMYRIYGLESGAGASPFDVFWAGCHPDDRESVRRSVEQALRDHEPVAFEHRIVRADGTVRLVHGRGQVVLDEASRPIRLVGTVQDITEQKALEERLREAQKMEAVGQLAGGVAHDFNNLLTIINGYSDLLLAGLRPGDPLADPIQQIKTAGERAAGVTRQLLAFSRRQVLAPRVLDLNAVIVGLEELLRQTAGGARLVTDLEPGLPPVRFDPDQIEQVLVHLAANAREAMPQGGTLTVRTRSTPGGLGLPRRHPGLEPGRYVLLEVRDTGVGMDEGTRARVFEPFFTTREVGKGTGLGLATVYGVVKQSEGHIDVDSRPGEGTTFRIYLARADAGAAPAAALAGAPRGSETVLVAEDEDLVRSLTRTVLRLHGYTVLEARDGAEALAVAANHPEPIHLLLTDVVMPHLGGPELADRLKAQRPGLRVVFVSGYTETVPPAGAPFLHKPFSPAMLARTVRETLDTRVS